MRYKKVERDGVRLTIHIDEDAPNPRKDYDQVGKMVVWHRRYNLGDEQPTENGDEWLLGLLSDTEKKWCFRAAYGRKPTLEEIDYLDDHLDGSGSVWEMIQRRYIIKPLYLYDHSGITMSTKSARFRMQDSAAAVPGRNIHSGPPLTMGAGWDWGQVGWIYCSIEKALEEWGPDPVEAREKADKYLDGEVQEYAYYLEGQVYGYTLEKFCQCGECSQEVTEDLDSCWGFIGPIDKNGMADSLGEYSDMLAEVS